MKTGHAIKCSCLLELCSTMVCSATFGFQITFDCIVCFILLILHYPLLYLSCLLLDIK